MDVPRISRLIRQPRFLARVFTPGEIAYCRGKRNAAQHYAVRFAAKEAVYKALGRAGVSHKQIWIEKMPSGKPVVRLGSGLKRWERKMSVSLSHTAEYAVAMALFQG